MKILRNILAVVIGVLIGGTVNMALIIASPSIIPLPEGIEPADMQSLVDNIGLFQPINFLMPFLAHALGTLIGAIIAGLIAASHKLYFSLIIGLFFLMGGISMSMDVDAPMWFDILDLVVAYIPMGLLGYWIAVKIGGSEKAA
jgi:hypothetical protein